MFEVMDAIQQAFGILAYGTLVWSYQVRNPRILRILGLIAAVCNLISRSIISYISDISMWYAILGAVAAITLHGYRLITFKKDMGILKKEGKI